MSALASGETWAETVKSPLVGDTRVTGKANAMHGIPAAGKVGDSLRNASPHFVRGRPVFPAQVAALKRQAPAQEGK